MDTATDLTKRQIETLKLRLAAQRAELAVATTAAKKKSLLKSIVRTQSGLRNWESLLVSINEHLSS